MVRVKVEVEVKAMVEVKVNMKAKVRVSHTSSLRTSMTMGSQQRRISMMLCEVIWERRAGTCPLKLSASP
jgi:hypothetical protein